MHISFEGKIGIWLAVLGILGAGALGVFPQQAFIGWSLIAVAAMMVLFLVWHHLCGWLNLSWKKGSNRKMVALAGMVVSGASFVGFLSVYFWPVTSGQPLPDVTLRFVYPDAPALVLANNSSLTARSIKYSVAIWNMDDPRTYTNPNPVPGAHDPLPIPVETFDFLRPNADGGPQAIFNSQLVSAHLRKGQRLFGSASVVCPDCVRGHTYIVSIIWGEGGWYAEVPEQKEGALIIPTHFMQETVISYRDVWTARIPEEARTSIRGAEGAHGVLESPQAAQRALSATDYRPYDYIDPSSKTPEIVSRSPRELMDFYKGRTGLQAYGLLKPYIGLRVRAEGKIGLLEPDGQGFVVTLRQIDGVTIECRLSPTLEARLGRYNQGDHMSVLGVISPQQNGQQLYLWACSLL